jgi:hypothetical protein
MQDKFRIKATDTLTHCDIQCSSLSLKLYKAYNIFLLSMFLGNGDLKE